VTTDLAAIPLLWVIPLALYLLSFILVFARRPPVPHVWMVRALPVVTLLVGFGLILAPGLASLLLVPLHWLALFVAAMVCHGELARDRPTTRYLTGFYLWISLGGMLGGMANVFVATVAFQGRALEYPLALVLACLLAPGAGKGSYLRRVFDVLAPCAVGLLALLMAVSIRETEAHVGWFGLLLAFAVPLVVGFAFSDRPFHFALPLAAAAFTTFTTDPKAGSILYSERNFFGLVRVRDDNKAGYRTLNHGSTQHGRQPLNDEKPIRKPVHDCEPTSYYHRSGPMGDVFRTLRAKDRGPKASPLCIAVTGLGAGALASYALPGEEWTFYEIDPAIVRIAQDPQLFTYLADAERRGATVNVVLGDARLKLRDAPEHSYDLIVQDAFTSDAVPTHLITRQALELYQSKKKDDGLLVFNVSNRYLDLRPVLADLAGNAGMDAYGRHDKPSQEEEQQGKTESSWVVLAKRDVNLGPIAQLPWQLLVSDPARRVWEDDYSNLVRVLRFGSSP
jgi:hypothetical protein